MADHGERIAVLETEVKALKEEFKQATELLTEINNNMVRYKGFIGGVFFFASCIGTFLGSMLWEPIKRKLGL